MDWVREYRDILNEARPEALLGTSHCPWSLEEYEEAIGRKLSIDLPDQAPYLDVFSITPALVMQMTPPGLSVRSKI